MDTGEQVYYFDLIDSDFNGLYEIYSIDRFFGDDLPYKVSLKDNDDEIIEVKRDHLKYIFPLNKVWCCNNCGNTDIYVLSQTHATTKEIVSEVNDSGRYYCNICDSEHYITTKDLYLKEKQDGK